jgi:hypothetical protein
MAGAVRAAVPEVIVLLAVNYQLSIQILGLNTLFFP